MCIGPIRGLRRKVGEIRYCNLTRRAERGTLQRCSSAFYSWRSGATACCMLHGQSPKSRIRIFRLGGVRAEDGLPRLSCLVGAMRHDIEQVSVPIANWKGISAACLPSRMSHVAITSLSFLGRAAAGDMTGEDDCFLSTECREISHKSQK